MREHCEVVALSSSGQVHYSDRSGAIRLTRTGGPAQTQQGTALTGFVYSGSICRDSQ